MMVHLTGVRQRRDLLKTKVVSVFLMERKYHMDKVFPELPDPGNASFPIVNGNHCFSSMQRDRAEFIIFTDKVIEQRKSVFGFTG